LICTLIMLISKFYPERGFEHYYSPLEANRDWKFVRIAGDPDPKYLAWKSINKSGVKFIWRNYGYQPDRLILDPVTKKKDLEFNILRKYVNSKKYGVAIQVLTRKGKQHWLACWKWNIFGKPTCYDPWNGRILWRPFGYLASYPRCTGYAIIKKSA